MRAAQLYIKETGKYIQLGQDGDFPFTLTKSIAEVQNVSKRNKTFSHTFKIPATEDNVKALGYPHVIGTDLDAVKNLRHACYVIVNGNVLEEGAVYVVSTMSDLDVRQFECVFIGGDEIWTEPLRTLKMSDLVSESVAYTDAGLQASFTSFTAGTDFIRWVNPYMYKFSDGQSPSATGDDFWLAYRVDKLLIRMIGEAALGLALQGLPYFQLDSVFIEQNDTGASHGFWDYIFWSDRSRGEYSVSFPNTLDGVAGGNIQIGEFFPTDVTALDFLLGFVRTFNCVMQWNNDTSTLKIEPRFDWESWDGTSYSGFYGTDVDWSEKISKANTVQYSLPYKRFIQLNYIADPNDSNNELLYGGKKELENDRPSGDLSTAANFPDRRYFVDTGNINEDGASVIDMYFHPSNPNLFSETFKKNYVASSFSLTPAFNNRFVKYDQIDFNHPNVFANRLFIYTRSAATDFTAGTNQWDSWRYTEDDGTTTVDYPTYPVMYTFGVFDDADGGTTLLNIGVYNNFSTLYTGGLYERFWKSTLDTFSTTRLLKTKVLMTRSEYIALDISNYFTALGQRFILNKVKDFDPMLDEQMVEVELLAVDAFRSSEEVTPDPGENIVEDGLIFRVDAGDTDSYGGTGTTWTDVINGNNGTILNGAAYNSAQGGYFEFDGVDDKVDFGQPAILESFPMSIDVWFYAASTGDGIITKGTTRQSAHLRDWDIFGNGSNLIFAVSDGSTSYPVNIRDSFPSLSTWHHLVVSWDGTTGTNGAKMYLDGALFAQGTSTSTTYATAHNIFVGGNRTGFYLDGRISMVKMYDKVLSAAEALQNYNASKDRYGL
jgi:hypothetical protein